MTGRARTLCMAMTALVSSTLPLACFPEDQRTGSIDQETWAEVSEAYSPEVRDRIDSGNGAYKAGDYSGALEHYQAAIGIDDEVAAAWFGIYMAQHARGNVEEAEQALEDAKAENRRLASRSNREWFVIGALVVIFGILVGLILPRIRWKKKSSWGEL